VRWERVEDDAPARMSLGRAAGTSEENKGPQARDITELNATQIHVHLARHISDGGQPGGQAPHR
jgi:hypothetical protein